MFNERIIKDEYKLAKEVNEYYICIVEKSGRTKLLKLGISAKLNGDEKIIDDDHLES